MTGAALRGRDATRPRFIPSASWRDVGLRFKEEIARHNISVVAAGVAFFGLFAVFPAIAALISIAALVSDPSAIEAQIAQPAGVPPQSAASILESHATKAASGAGGAGGLAAVGGILLAIYGASKGMKTLMEGVTTACDEEEARGFLTLNATASALTLLLILGVLIAFALVMLARASLGALGLGESAKAWAT